ncbi:MAG: hypothetical protein COU51_00370 [Parcubacteria group bacterium CG10_big_fil_rev_8_21_14_0_10_36_14]|nr:MAG: hypothetical protein COU51_00370 [Parcubacteria group bacterium CG10_big_fil_rev_8_21_14_0_10_36_14]
MARKSSAKNWQKEPEAPKVKCSLRTFKCSNCGEKFESNKDAYECPFCGSPAIIPKEEEYGKGCM